MNTLKSIYKDTTFILSLRQPKYLYRELASSRFISNYQNTRKPETYKWSHKRCEMCQNYLNESNKFAILNGQIWEICGEIDCYSVSYII